MLNKSSVIIGTNLSSIFVDNNIKLVPKQNTLMNELVNSISSNMLTNNIVTDISFIEDTIYHASLGTEQTVKGIKNYIESSHDAYMDNYIEDLSKLVTGYVSYARNVVNKRINLFKEEINSSLSNYKYKEPEEFFNVTYFKLDDIFMSSIIIDEINSYKDSSNKYSYKSVNLESIKNEEFDIAKYLLIGDSEIDLVIASFINKIGKENCIYYVTGNVKEYEFNSVDMLNFSIVNYLFYRNLLEKTDINTGNSISTLKTICSDNKDYFGNKLNVSLEIYTKELNLGKIICGGINGNFSYFNKNPLNIIIYEESFRKLSEAGFSIECVFGYLSSVETSNDITVNKLIEDGSKWLDKWNTVRSLYMISLNNDRLDIFKQIVRERLESSLNQLEDEDEREFVRSNSSFMDETKRLSNEYIDSLSVSDMDKIDEICLELISKIRYRFTNSYFILKEMSEILKMNDKIEPMEAALYATIKYLTDYMLEQLSVVKV